MDFRFRATDHMSPHKSLFKSYEPVTKGHRVFIANGGILEIAGKGIIEIKGTVLRNVLHVPALKANLLSLLLLVIDTGCRFILDSDSCFHCTKDTGKKILSIKRKGGLLLLEELKEDEEQKVAYTIHSEEQIILLHRRLGHPSFHLLKQTHPTMFKGVNIERLICESCQFAKHRRSSFPNTNHRYSSAFECVHSDVWGPCSISGLPHHKWFILFVDNFSRYTWVYLLKTKSEIPKIIVLFCEMIHNQFRNKFRLIRTDNAKEYFCEAVNKYMEDKGIIHQSSCVNTPLQNGLAKKKIGHIMSSARALLFQGNCPKFCWSEVVATAIHLINRTPLKTLNLKAPIDLLSSEYPHLCLKTNLSAKIFGCVVYVHLHHIGKLDHRAIKCIFLGYSTRQKGYKCYHPSSRKVFITADAKFDDIKMFYDEASRSKGYLDSMAPEYDENEDHRMTQLELSNPAPGSNEQNPDASTIPSPIEEEEESYTLEITQNDAEKPKGDDVPSNNRWSIAVSKGVRECTQTKLYPVSNYVSYTRMSPEYNLVIQAIMTVSIPKNVQEANSSNEWRKAMNEEMEALEKNGTWEMGPLPVGKKLVGSRWVFTIKYHSDGLLARYKARLVTLGYTQSYGIDYNETFAPVAKLNTIRILIALAAMFDWKLFQFDVNNVFLHGELEEKVYMAPPPGYSLRKNTGDVCHLKKSIYGLKQSPRAWFGKFPKTMLSAGYA